MKKSACDPIFVHSLFRTGSTYFFHVFRRASANGGDKLFMAFQEPIHEAVFDNAANPHSLSFFSGVGAIPKELRHPEIGASYFSEMIEIAAAWAPLADPEIVYDDYFGGEAKTIRFMNSLIEAARRRPVFCDCRTAMRIARLRDALGGVHAYLWRNPWDQWWSLKATDYFDSINQIIASGPHVPESVTRLAAEVGIHPPAMTKTSERFEYFKVRRLSAEQSYRLHYLLWMLALESGLSSADFDVNVDKLSENSSYRDAITAKFAAVGALGLDFSDAAIPRSAFDEEDRAFFIAQEMRVRAILLESGWSTNQLDALDTVRRLNAPQSIAAGGESRLRGIIRRLETRDSGIARKFDDDAAAARADAENLRAIANGVHAAVAEAASAVRAQASMALAERDAALAAAKADADTRIAAADAQLRAAAAERDQALAAAKADADARIAAADAQLSAAAAERDQALTAAKADADARIAAADAQLSAAMAERDQALARVEEAKAAFERETLAQSQAESKLRAALSAETQRARDLDWEAKRAALHAQHVETRLAATYDSASWKMTAPVRAIGMAARHGASGGRRLMRSIARPLLAAGLSSLRAAPPLKRVAHAALRRTPLGAPLFRFALARPATAPAAATSIDAPSYSSGAASHVASEGPRRILYYYVDHTIDCPVNTGVQRVVRGLASGLLAAKQPVVFVRWSRATKRLVRINRAQLQRLGEWNGPKADSADYPADDEEVAIESHHARDNAWLIAPEVAYINHEGDEPTLDVIMAAKQAKLKTAFVFYDAIPLRRAEFIESAERHENYMRALLLADFVAPISQWSATDLASCLVHHERADLTQGPAIKALLLPASPVDPLDNGRGRTSEKLILAVGTIEQRKNQGALIAAFEKFSAAHPGAGWRLELIGNLHPNMAAAVNEATARNASIRYRGNLSDEDLGALLAVCAFTVFPSVEEGFGLPILESVAHGKPCICADFGAMAEVAEGGGCLQVDTRDVDALARAIETLALDGAARERLAIEAKKRKLATWDDYATAFAGELETHDSPLSDIGRIFYFIDQTAAFESNTGIQRVVRGLGRALQEVGAAIVPVKWDMAARDFKAPEAADIAHLAKWNGPATDRWRSFSELKTAQPGDWLLIPEVVSSPAGPQIADIHRQARARGLKIAWVFYDAIPFKLKEYYPVEATQAHGAYMRALAGADLRLSISEHSNHDLVQHLAALESRQPRLFETTLAVPLPGEFRGASRRAASPPPTGGPIKILSVGTIEPRKNHLTMLRAFEDAARRLGAGKVELTLVGIAPYPALAEEVAALVDRSPAIRWLRKASDEKLRDLYDDAHFTVYPSVEEGFGLPILESLWNGRPCICRNDGAMAEVAVGGGCLMTDTTSQGALANAIYELTSDPVLRRRLTEEALARRFRAWSDYASDVLRAIASESTDRPVRSDASLTDRATFDATFCNLKARPTLSVCITTYNRASWLDAAIRNLVRLIPEPRDDVEIVVVDNTSTDTTPDIAAKYATRPDFRFYRNPENVGMLGNLRVTADRARGEYVWVLGDDDLAAPGSIDAILGAITSQRDTALVYLNYAYTREDDATKITDFDAFFASATPIAKPSDDLYGSIASISAMNENFFTAIYCLVFRRDHALRAYAQDTSGRPFSTMLTCIPTTYHVLYNMMREKGVWLGTPQLVVNMNVSWLKYAPIWILERIPEAIDVAERFGAPVDQLDERRRDLLPSVKHWFSEILRDDPEGNRAYFDPRRTFARFKHLPEFRALAPELVTAFYAAERDGVSLPAVTAAELDRLVDHPLPEKFTN